MSDDGLYYKLSGQYRLSGLLATLVVAVLAAAALGLVYGIVERYNPIIYVNFLGTLFFGYLLAKVVIHMARAGHVRNRMMIAGLALIAGVMVEYFAIMGWLLALSDWEALFISPAGMFEVLGAISEKGAWTLRGAEVNGAPLIIIWIIEAGILIGCPVFIAWGESKDLAYCETCGRWLDTTTSLGPFAPIADPSAMRQALEAGEFTRLGEITPHAAGTNTFSLMQLRQCSQCSNLNLLDMNNVTVTKDKEGKDQTTLTPVVTHMLLDRESHDLLREVADQIAAAGGQGASEAKAGDEKPAEG